MGPHVRFYFQTEEHVFWLLWERIIALLYTYNVISSIFKMLTIKNPLKPIEATLYAIIFYFIQ